MKLKQFIMDDNVQREFLDSAKEFLDKAKDLGYPLSGITTAILSQEEDDEEGVAAMTSIYLYRGNAYTPSHMIELLEEYAEESFMDEATNLINVYRVYEYIVVTIIAST